MDEKKTREWFKTHCAGCGQSLKKYMGKKTPLLASLLHLGEVHVLMCAECHTCVLERAMDVITFGDHEITEG